MKSKFMKYSPSAMLMGLLIVFSVGCKKEEIEPYGTITSSESGPTATDTNPAVATADHPVQISWSMHSTYADYDTHLVTCDPKASIQMTVAKPHITVKDIKELTNMKETISESKTGGKYVGTDNTPGVPTVISTTQTYEIGGQTITFNASYDRYSYQNIHGISVYMPYLLVGQVKYGDPKPVLKQAADVPDLPYVTSITVRPARSATRGSLILEDLYDVTVKFNVDTEIKESKEKQKKTYSFQASYQATVENVFEYPEPVTSASYIFRHNGDTAVNESPYTIHGTELLELEWNGQSRHVWFDAAAMEQKLFSSESHAQVKVSMSVDTLSAYNTSNIEDMIADFSAGEPEIKDDETEHKGHRIWTIAPLNKKLGKQTITIDWSFAHGDSVETSYGKVIMPSMKLSDPEFIDLKLTPVEADPNKPAKGKMYEVTARIKQTFSILNDTALNKTGLHEEALEYVLKYNIVEDIILSKVSYRKTYEWVEATDSTAFAFYPIVYRDRTYSNGEVFTDTFIDDPHFVNWTSAVGPSKYTDKGGEMAWGNGYKIVYQPAKYSNKDSVFTSSIVVGVPKISYLSTRLASDGYKTSYPGVWEFYKLKKQFGPETVIPMEGVEIVGTYEKSTKDNGWYIFEPVYFRQLDVVYNELDTPDPAFLSLSLSSNFIDCYVVVDGFKMTYLEGRNQMNLSYKDEKTSYNGYTARKYTHEGTTTYFGKKFHVVSEATVYQLPSDGEEQKVEPVTTRSVRDAASDRESALSHLPVPYGPTPRFIYGGKPKGVKGRY